MRLRFLGTGSAVGVPAFFCGCRACEEAIADGKARRTRSSVVLEGEAFYLLDASPDLRTQFLREHVSRLDGLFLTHQHFDHSGGIGELESYVRISRREPLPAYLTKESRRWLESAFGYMSDCFAIQEWAAGWQIDLREMVVTAVEAQHEPGTVGILIETAGGSRTAYLPDTGPLPEATKKQLEGVDTLILGATFWKGNWMPETHLSIEQAVDLGLELKVGRLYLTHLAMHHQPVTNREVNEYLWSRGRNLHMACDGMCIEI